MKARGFTVLEFLILLLVLLVLAAIVLPAWEEAAENEQAVESLTASLTEQLPGSGQQAGMQGSYLRQAQVSGAMAHSAYPRMAIVEYFLTTGSFPSSNEAASLPPADKMISPSIVSTQVVDGAIHITMGNNVTEDLKGKMISFRPAIVVGNPQSDVFWLCGYEDPVPNMAAAGTNRTNIPARALPAKCR
jgi:type IV pilus assembly protein PilA